MAEEILINCKLYYGGYDFSGSLNSCTLTHSADAVEATVFGNTTRKRRPGLKDTMVNAGGLTQTSSESEDIGMFKFIGGESGSSNNYVLSLLPNGTSGTNSTQPLSYFGKSISAEYAPGGNVGEMYSYTLSAEGNGDLYRGPVVLSGTSQAAASGTRFNLGEISSTQSLHAAVQFRGATAAASSADLSLSIITCDTSAGAGGGYTTMITFPDADLTHVPYSIYQSTGQITGGTSNFWYFAQLTCGATSDVLSSVVTLAVK